MIRIIAILTMVFLLGGLIGCGSGGSNAGTTPGQAQGVYFGTTGSGLEFDLIVLPDDRFYAAYGVASSSPSEIMAGLPSGIMAGQGESSNGTYTAMITDYSWDQDADYAGSVSATYVTGPSFSGTVTETGQPSVSFTTSMAPTSTIDFNSQASLLAITGTWGTSFTVIVSSSGALSMSPFSGGFSGCTASGTISPDASGKNFYNVSLIFSGASCPVANRTGTGIAIVLQLPDGVTHRLAGMGTFGLGSFYFSVHR